MSALEFDYDEKKYTTFRRLIHKYPELGNKEFETQVKILNLFNEFPNYNSKTMLTTFENETGLWVDVQGKAEPTSNSNKFIALRCDMDALQLIEETKLDYRSVNEGIAHSCGHDGHITILCCTLEQILKRVDILPSNLKIRFLYQPAEEGLGGAIRMIKNGCLNGIDEIYGIHNMPLYPLGYISIKSGPVMAAADIFKINIQGKGGHGSTPHLCNSPITSGGEIITKINEITSHRINSINRSVVTVGKFVSGEAANVIPDQAEILGTIRTFDVGIASTIKNEISHICNDISKLNHSTTDVEFTSIGSVTNNEQDTFNNVIQSLKESKLQITSEGLPLPGSEDFSFYQEKVKGTFIFLGTGDQDHVASPHSPEFDYNDKGTIIGAEIYLRLIQYLAQKQIFKNK